MATSSFTQDYVVRRKDVSKLLNIIKDEKKVRVPKVKSHKELKGNSISKFLNTGK